MNIGWILRSPQTLTYTSHPMIIAKLCITLKCGFVTTESHFLFFLYNTDRFWVLVGAPSPTLFPILLYEYICNIIWGFHLFIYHDLYLMIIVDPRGVHV
jgi:hypothetical protein